MTEGSQDDRTHPSSRDEKEIDSFRDRLQDDYATNTDALSTIIRTVSTGLTLIFYTFLTSDKPSPFLSQHLDAMRAGSIIGLLALVADALQYAAAVAQVTGLRRLVSSGEVPERLPDLIKARANFYGHVRVFFFVSKSALAATGVVIVILALAQASPATLAP